MQIASRVAPPILFHTGLATARHALAATMPWSAPSRVSAAPGPQPPLPAGTRLERLNRLAQTLGRGFQARLRGGTEWRYLPQERVITCPPHALAEHTDGYNIGRVCRELARLRYSQQGPTGAAVQQAPILEYVWQVAETLRVSRLMAGRYAGAHGLLAEVAATDRPLQAHVPPLVQWGEGCLAAWGGDARPVQDAQAQAALQALQPLLDEITAPPSQVDLRFDDLSAEETQAEADRARQAVVERLLPAVLRHLPPQQQVQEPPAPQQQAPSPPPQDGPTEAAPPAAPPGGDNATQDGSKQDDDAPEPSVGQALAEAIGRLAPKLQPGTPETPATAEIPETPATPATPETSPASPPPESPLSSSQVPKPAPCAEAAPPVCELDVPRPSGPAGSGGRSYTDAATPADAVDLEAALRALRVPQGYYEELCAAHAADIDAMEHALEEAFELRRHPKPQGYYPSGQFHLPRALQADFRRQATGVSDTRLYRRKTPPTQRSVGFVLVLDRSASMQGESIVNLQRAAALLLEPARRLQMDVGIISYDSFAHVLKQPTDDLSPAACDQLMDQLAPQGNNNEQAALTAAQAMAEGIDTDDVYIIFVTDGGGDPHITQRIAELEHTHPSTKVVGVGIGAGCAEVPRLYPRHLSVADVAALPHRLAELFVGLQTHSSEEA